MAESQVGAIVKYCGHDGCFLADIVKVGTANVIHASRPVTMENLERPAANCTRHLVDFPNAGFWKPHHGVFVVPSNQVKEL